MSEDLHRGEKPAESPWRRWSRFLLALPFILVLVAGIALTLMKPGGSGGQQTRAGALVAELERSQATDGLSRVLRKYLPGYGKGRKADEVVEEMAALGPEAVPELIAATRHKVPFIRSAAAWALGEIGDARATPALVAALKGVERNERVAAASSLGLLRDPRAVDALAAALADKDRDVRAASALALAMQRRPEAVPVLAGIVAGKGCDVAAVMGLALVGTLEARQALAAAASGAASPALRRLAGRAQAKPAAEALAEELREEDPALHVHVINALAYLRDPAGLPALEEALKNPNPDIRDAASYAVRQIRRAHPPQGAGGAGKEK